MGKLFGTDGIRGKANTYPMTVEMALIAGKAVASYFRKIDAPPKIVIGRDTRLSGDMIEGALVAGICANGGEILRAGVIPTPGVAFLCRHMNASAGIVISASHNPYTDNGIKLFSGNGSKLPDEVEAAIESMIVSMPNPTGHAGTDRIGRAGYLHHAIDHYIDFLTQIPPASFDLSNLKIVLDCANGATFKVAPRLFRDLGAEVISLFVDPDGQNINAGCGSQHPEPLAKAVVEHRADVGLAFDGDGDRLISVDENGRVLSGDQILAVCANHMKNTGTLDNNLVVSTVMSNIGFRKALKQVGIQHRITGVGDRYVLAEMRETGAVLGGEDSGHIIFLNHHSTGDGIIAGLKLVEVMLQSGRTLSELAEVMQVFPQALINVEVSQKPDIENIPRIKNKIDSVEKQLGGMGRVLVRYSGTQDICRVMVEGPSRNDTDKYAGQIAEAIRQMLA
ncbi:MAG: phosphoglucosamine mutase [Desulfobacteraceae bacterium]|nr:phosphoglucosamine mutase [Desulfobacteraceae bacterium]